MYNTNWQYNIACITTIPTGLWWVSNSAIWLPHIFFPFCLWIPSALKMHFLFTFKAKPLHSHRMSERSFLPFDSTIEGAGSVPKVSSCNCSHQSLIPRETYVQGISVGWGQVPGSQPSLYAGTTFLEGTVEAVSSLSQLIVWDWARNGCSKLWSPRINEVLDPAKHISYRPVSSSVSPSSLPLEIKPLRVPCYKLMSLKKSPSYENGDLMVLHRANRKVKLSTQASSLSCPCRGVWEPSISQTCSFLHGTGKMHWLHWISLGTQRSHDLTRRY